MHMGKLSEKKHTHRDSTGSVMPSGEGLRVLTAAVYRGHFKKFTDTVPVALPVAALRSPAELLVRTRSTRSRTGTTAL